VLVEQGASTIVQSPLVFVRSGDIGVSGSAVSGVGHAGYMWSSTGSLVTGAYDLGISPMNVLSTGNNHRYYGFLLRY